MPLPMCFFCWIAASLALQAVLRSCSILVAVVQSHNTLYIHHCFKARAIPKCKSEFLFVLGGQSNFCMIWIQTFGWFTQFGTIDVSEHFYIFWLGPMLGGLLAGLTWRAFVVTKPGQQEGNTVIVDQPQTVADEQKSSLTKKAD